jgi:general secretion pathway protein M
MAVEALPKPLRRIAALSLVGVALGLAALIAIAPFARMSAVGEEIAAAAELIDRQERLLKATAGRPTQLTKEVFLAGGTTGIAGAELQHVVSQLAGEKGLSLRSAHVTPPKREADLTVVAVDVVMNGRMEALRSLFHAIETGLPILFIESLSIRAMATPQPGLQPASLDITLRVRGYGAGKETN